MIIAISGTSQGLGLELAKYFRAKGHEIIGFGKPNIDVFSDDAKKAVDNYYYCDLAIEEEVLQLCTELENHKPDVLIFNAAIKDFDSIEKFTPARIRLLLDVNLKANFIITSLVVKGMISREFGRLVFVASKSSYYGYSSGALYTASKGALFQYTESVSKDLDKINKNITINTIAPDAFFSREGVKAVSYDAIVRNCAVQIDSLLSTNISGKIIPVVSAKERMIIALKQIISGIKLLFTYK